MRLVNLAAATAPSRFHCCHSNSSSSIRGFPVRLLSLVKNNNNNEDNKQVSPKRQKIEQQPMEVEELLEKLTDLNRSFSSVFMDSSYRRKRKSNKTRQEVFWENVNWFRDRTVYHFTHFTHVAKLTLAVPVAFSLLELNHFLLLMTVSVWSYNWAVQNTKANTAALHPRIGIRLVNMMFPSVQMHINLERAITSRVNFKLAYHPAIHEIFGHSMVVRGPLSCEVLQKDGVVTYGMVYRVVGNSKTGDVSFVAILLDHMHTGRSTLSNHTNFNPFIGEQGNRWYQVKLCEASLKVYNDISYEEMPLDLDQIKLVLEL
eukprot:TRINITY_DN7809_c0_g1_i1.p1 TRINITY_DN7809_c0_g1~~TRINITY_DN7809_c0_g1_i1.p1  ORF type:complete len:316 (+),score=68.94 TRINITY_DN7809_c0_g1_i1:781-1728(+)